MLSGQVCAPQQLESAFQFNAYRLLAIDTARPDCINHRCPVDTTNRRSYGFRKYGHVVHNIDRENAVSIAADSSATTSRTRSRASYDLAGRVGVVTGGSNGIGAAIVTSLREAGARVIVWDREERPGPDHLTVDVTDMAAVERAAGQLPQLDILVNNAGYAGPTVPLDQYPADEWRRVIDINLLGTFNVCRATVPILRKAGAGHIINISSLAGKEGTPNASAYSAAKAGVMALTKSLGKELASAGVLVNAIAPAAVRTRLLEQMSPAHVQIMVDKSPMRRLIEPAEVAELVMWLCSDSCTCNTGAVFDLSGGRAAY
jgi:3-oxoacyl-[acyl-carrier protein] reductase